MIPARSVRPGAPARSGPRRPPKRGSSTTPPAAPGAIAVCALIASAAACTRGLPDTAEPAPPPAEAVPAGCADPERDGVVSDDPDLERADRDLNGDGRDEIVVADRALCTPEDNCHWNLFAAQRRECPRFLGTVSGVAIEEAGEVGEDGFPHLRGWWQLADEGRMLMQAYIFRDGRYRIEEAVPCAAGADGRIICGEEGGPGERAPPYGAAR